METTLPSNYIDYLVVPVATAILIPVILCLYKWFMSYDSEAVIESSLSNHTEHSSTTKHAKSSKTKKPKNTEASENNTLTPTSTTSLALSSSSIEKDSTNTTTAINKKKEKKKNKKVTKVVVESEKIESDSALAKKKLLYIQDELEDDSEWQSVDKQKAKPTKPVPSIVIPIKEESLKKTSNIHTSVVVEPITHQRKVTTINQQPDPIGTQPTPLKEVAKKVEVTSTPIVSQVNEKLVADLQRSNISLQKELANVKDKHDKVLKDLIDNQRTYVHPTTHKNTMELVQGELDKCQVVISNLSKEKNNLEHDLRQAQGDLDKGRSQEIYHKKLLDAEVQKCKSQYSCLLEESKTECIALHETIRNLQSKLDVTANQNGVSLKEREGIISKLETELETLNKEIEIQRKKNHDLASKTEEKSHGLEKELSTLREENKKLQKVNQEFLTDKKESNKKLEATLSEKQQAGDQQSSLQQQIETQQAEINSLKGSVEVTSSSANALKKENEVLTERLQTLEKEVQESKSNSQNGSADKHQEETITELNANVKRLEKEKWEQVSEKCAEIDSLKHELHSKSDMLNNTEQCLKDLEKTFSSVKEQVISLEGELKDVRVTNETLSKRLGEKENDLKTKDSTAQGLEEVLKKIEVEMDVMREENNSLKSEKIQLEKEVNLASAQSDVGATDLNEKVITLTKQIDEITETKTQVEKKLQETNSTCDSLKKQLEENKSQQEKKLSEKEEALAKLTSESAILKEVIAEVTKSKESLARDVSELTKKHAAEVERCAKLKDSLFRMTSEDTTKPAQPKNDTQAASTPNGKDAQPATDEVFAKPSEATPPVNGNGVDANGTQPKKDDSESL